LPRVIARSSLMTTTMYRWTVRVRLGNRPERTMISLSDSVGSSSVVPMTPPLRDGLNSIPRVLTFRYRFVNTLDGRDDDRMVSRLILRERGGVSRRRSER